MSDTETQAPPEASGAVPGCIILGAIITVFGGLIILYITIFFVQKKAFAGFTSDTPAQIQVMEPTEAQVAQMRAKLAAVKSATSESKRERILITRDDLNTMIATIDILKDFRGTTYIQSITSDGIQTRMTQPTRKIPMVPGQRHINAKFIFYPELRKRTIALRVRDIISDDGSVPLQFVQNYDTIGFFRLDPENPDIKPVIPKLSRVYLEGENIVVETGPPADDQGPLPE